MPALYTISKQLSIGLRDYSMRISIPSNNFTIALHRIGRTIENDTNDLNLSNYYDTQITIAHFGGKQMANSNAGSGDKVSLSDLPFHITDVIRLMHYATTMECLWLPAPMSVAPQFITSIRTWTFVK
jgi:hypothetical protein